MRLLFSLTIFLLFFGCTTKPYIVEPVENDAETTQHKDVYVIGHGWHTGFVLPAKEIQLHLPKLKERFKNTPYIEFGWGDKDFYQAKEITTGLTIRAIFWPTESVMHTVAVPMNINEYFPKSKIERLSLQGNEFEALVRFIVSSFYRDENGQIVVLKDGIYGNSQFYKGVGDYYLMNTCNKWTAKGLKSAGLNLSTTFKLTASSIMNYLETHKSPNKTNQHGQF